MTVFWNKLRGKASGCNKAWGKICSCMLIACLLFGLAACGKDGNSTKVVFTTGFGRDEVFRIGSESCRKNEVMVYLTTIQNKYEQVYGEPIWGVEVDGLTMEDNVKETVLARIAQIKTMYLLAKDRGVVMDEEEEACIVQAATEYYEGLNATERELLDVDMEVIENLYRQYALADKVYRGLIEDVNPEISDDEARTITVQQILIRTVGSNGNGTTISYTETMKADCYEKIRQIRELALDGEHDFLELATQYSDDPMLTASFGKGEREDAFEEAAFNLETDEISGVVETPEGYWIIKCINTFDREETDANKIKIVEQRRKEAFGREYDSFVEGLIRNLNQKLWAEVTLIHDERVKTSDFFEIYDRYFGR